jgi:hypothetical protein
MADLRLDATGSRGAFEEFCCQMFRRAPEAPANGRYRRVRGDGGDGGVEALWIFPAGEAWGLQAKFFNTMGSNQKAQLAESVQQAVANYPNLTRYTICLPFNLTAKTGAKAGKSKRGQHEQLSEWITEWRSDLGGAGRAVQFDVWDESELRSRLAAADTTGGLARYWFDEEVFTAAWFAERLAEAKAQAGPRYSPELSVATPLDTALQAFGRSELWTKRIEALASNYADKLDWWRKTADDRIEALSSLPKELADEAKAVGEAAEPLEQSLGDAGENPDRLTLPEFRAAVRRSIERGSVLEPKLKEALVAIHGKSADSPGFRQWSAEYMADFPMASLDHLRDLLTVLREVEVLAFQPESQLPAATGMLLHGEAGVGKTHGIIDAAVRRHDSGLPSLVLFGEDVTGDPWQALITKLGLGSGMGRDAILDALNAAGEATGFPLVIFIDALNETQPDRRKWQSWLPPMLEHIKRRSFLKLCVSCREIYVREVMPPGLAIPAIEHNGFLGREYEAQFAFFQHYGLGVPGEPLLQEEFANPLFLRLVCEALRDRGAQAIPAGREGIRAIINLLLLAKNERAAAVCDYDSRENRVSEAMLRLAGAMASAGSRTLPLADARSLVDRALVSQSKSLFALLESESLVSIIERPGVGLGAEASYSARFTFERIGDHLIAEHLLASIADVQAAFAVGGTLSFLVASNDAVRANAGLLEALSIQLPEAHGTELIDVPVDVDQAVLWDAFIAGLQWRNPQFVSERTTQLVREALSSNETVVASMLEALLGIAARPDHPLNARFIDRILRGIPLLARDPFWAHRLEVSYSGWSDTVRPKSSVNRLIETARRGNLDNLSEGIGMLWAIVLAWFYASPDRRIRDQATMAMVSIFRVRPSTIAPLLRRFLLIDDEYISERVLVAAYGGLLLSESRPELHTAAEIVHNFYFVDDDTPLNASLRDHARLVIELSVELGVAPEELDAARYRPPYPSIWPVPLPTENDVKAYAEDKKRFPQMSLVQKTGLATGTDFARYVVEPRVTDAFDIAKTGLDKLAIFRWFLKEAVDFGYPGPSDQCAQFDRALLGEFGGGRGKPGWAERLGKKYYWIFLRRLVGHIADHVDRKTWSGTFPPSDELQGLDLRDIDPTDIRQFLSPPSGDHAWLMPAPYQFRGPDVPQGDAVWVSEDDLTNIANALSVTDREGTVWQVLDMGASWNGKRKDQRRQDTYRHVTRSVRAATCEVADIGKVKKAFAKTPLDHFNHGPHDYRGYLGEYPQRWPYARRTHGPVTFDGEDDGIRFQHLALHQLRGREWERDYSPVGESPSILMPSPALIWAGNLQWDRRGGWQDANGQIQIQDPWWWSDKGPALICRIDYMDRFLDANNKALIILGFQMKFVADVTGGGGRLTERTLFIRHQGKTKLAERNMVRD